MLKAGENPSARKDGDRMPPWRFFGAHPYWWGASALLVCLGITALITILARLDEVDRNLNTFEERAQLRVNALA